MTVRDPRRIRNQQLRDQIATVIREHGPMTTRQIHGHFGGPPYIVDLYRHLILLEQHAVITGDRDPSRRATLWSYVARPMPTAEGLALDHLWKHSP